MSEEPTTQTPTGGFFQSRLFRNHRLQLSIFGIFLLLWLAYIIGNPLAFTSYPIYRAFMSTMPFFGIIAVSATLVITLGEIDLSFPSVVGLTSFLFGTVLVDTGSFWLAFSVCGHRYACRFDQWPDGH